MKIKVGIAQIQNSTDIEQNFSQIMSLLLSFENTGVSLILFPECSLSGFTTKMKECSKETLTPYLNAIKNWSEKKNINVVLPTAFVDKGSVYNSGFWIKGNEHIEFYKLGLTESEKKFFSTPNQCTRKVFSVNDFNFAVLLCFEAEHEPWSYFKKGEADAILWPGYWGWTPNEKWTDHRDSERSNPIFKNMTSWKVPLLQSNFASNDLEGHVGAGPEGLSFVVGHDNQLILRGPHLQIGGLVAELSKESGHTQVTDHSFLSLKA